MSRIAENLLVQLVEWQPERTDEVVIVDESSGAEATFPVTDSLRVKARIEEAQRAGEQVLDIEGILIERAAWPSLVSVLEYFQAASLDQFTPADYE